MGILEGILLGAICCVVVFSVCLLTNPDTIEAAINRIRKIPSCWNRRR